MTLKTLNKKIAVPRSARDLFLSYSGAEYDDISFIHKV